MSTPGGCSPHLCAPSFAALGQDAEHPTCPALLSSPLFIPHKLSLLFHHLQEVSPDFRPAWATTFKPLSSWVGTKAVVKASRTG